ncbi:MAG: hypothetical protein A2045_04895 [Rhodocyclales bacterium GWA2_65_20]|nr:MAG: hypothetical protein A2045_04895 [Rhodocyclales bacterium GWA2_65_20]
MKILAIAFLGLALAAGLARAELNIDINTPPVVIQKHRMVERTQYLVRFYDAGSIGLAKSGDIAMRDATGLTPQLRRAAELLVEAETTDRKALVHAIAHSNGKPEAQPEVRAAMIKRWRENWKSGWYIQDDMGNWAKKP